MRKPLFRKILPYALVFLGIAYGIWPLDIIPDIPVIGWLDDLGVMGSIIAFIFRRMGTKKTERNAEEGRVVESR